MGFMNKFLLLSLLLLSAKNILAADPSSMALNLDENEVKEEVASALNINAQQIEVVPAAIEFVKAKDDDGLGLKGRLFITWSVKDTVQTNSEMTYSNAGINYTSNGSSLEGSAKGNINNSVKIGYQVFENLGVEAGYEKSSSTMSLASSSSGAILGKVSSSYATINNEFQSVKIGLVSNANVYNGKSFRMDLVGSVNGGVIIANSTYKTDGDVYSGAFGYSYGAEAGVRVLHKSGVYVSTGVGMNNKVLAPKTWQDGSHTQFNSSDKYVFINVGYSFGGKRR